MTIKLESVILNALFFIKYRPAQIRIAMDGSKESIWDAFFAFTKVNIMYGSVSHVIRYNILNLFLFLRMLFMVRKNIATRRRMIRKLPIRYKIE